MKTNLAVLPFFIPLITAAFLYLVSNTKMLRNTFAMLSSLVQVFVSFIVLNTLKTQDLIFLPLGGWKVPYGITITIDHISAVMIALCTIVSLVCVIYTLFEKKTSPIRLSLMQFIASGIVLSFATGDFFNLFVAFEIMLISSYALMTLELSEKDTKYAFPYIAINLVGSALFLGLGGLVYVFFGSLNFADISNSALQIAGDQNLSIIAILMVAVFGLKAGMFPLFYWLPRSYSVLPYPLAALFSAMLTKVGIYTLFRCLVTLMPHHLINIYDFILILSIPTMVIGIMGALYTKNMKEILCYNLVSHIGFMMVGIGIFSQDSLSAALFYAIHHIIVMGSLFLIIGIINQLQNSDNIDDCGGLWDKVPVLGLLFLLQALSLAGLPPFSGFWGKLLIIQASVKDGAILPLIAIVIASILTLLSLLRIWLAVFWGQNTAAEFNEKSPWSKMSYSVSILVAVSLIIGLFPNRFIIYTETAIQNMLNQQKYIQPLMNYPGERFAEKYESGKGHH